MLEGLEVSEVLFSNIDLGDRFDAEFFNKFDLVVEEKLKMLGAKEFRDYGDFVASAFYPAATHLYEVGDIPFIRCVDCVNYPLITTQQDDLFEKIPYDFLVEQKSVNQIKRADLVITKVGTPSYPSIVYEHDFVALSRTVLGVKNIRGINPYYLLVFLRSKYGFSQLQRNRELTIQYQLTLERTKRVLVYKPSDNFQNMVEKIVHQYILELNKSKLFYQKAEKLLLEELDLLNFQPDEQGINVKSLKDSFLTYGRLDAEYYQPKYDDYLKLIKSYPEGYDKLATVCTLKDSNYNINDDEQYQYIELSNIGKTGDITGATVDFGKNLPSRARRKVIKGDVIVSSIEGSLSSCALVGSDYDNALCSTGFYVINSKKINSETLLILFKSELMQNILKQNCSGTILTAINKAEFINILVPLIKNETQKQIAELIQQSFALKTQSEQLLEDAKKLVEMAIEEGEERALAWYETNLKYSFHV